MYLGREQCVDARSTWEDGEWETDDCADDKTKLYYLTQKCRPKVHQHIAGDFMVVESNVAKETDLGQIQRHSCMDTQPNMHTLTKTWHKLVYALKTAYNVMFLPTIIHNLPIRSYSPTKNLDMINDTDTETVSFHRNSQEYITQTLHH